MTSRLPTVVLLVLAACLSGALLLLLSGAGQNAEWLPAPSSHPVSNVGAKSVALPAMPLEQLASSWQHPIFSPDRQPDLASAPQASSQFTGVLLTGVILDGQAQWALLRLADKRSVKLKVGDALDNGWTLSHLDPLQATFTHQGQSRLLSLPVLRLPPPSKAPALTLPHVSAP